MPDTTTTTIFNHLNAADARSAQVGVIFFTFWLGALAWDVASTLHFDVRLVGLTRWSSPPAALHALSYLCSRWTSLAFLALCVSISVDPFDDCQKAWTAVTAIFIVAVCSTCLVFCLRTMSIWNVRARVAVPLGVAWLCMVGVGIAVPIKGVRGTQVPESGYCDGDIDHVWFLVFIATVVIFDGLALVFTVLKFNRQGYRGLLHSLTRMGRRNIVDEVDLETMLMRRTTAFFLIQFLLLGGAIIFFFSTDQSAYHPLLIVACQAVAASMAGRITRRAWRLTHAPPMLLPDASYAAPSYHTGMWAELMRSPGSLAAYTSNLSLRSGLDEDPPACTVDPDEVAKAWKVLFGRAGCAEKDMVAAPRYVEGEMTYRRPSNAGEGTGRSCSQVALATVAAAAAGELGPRRKSLPALSVSATARSAALHAVKSKADRPHTSGPEHKPRNLRFSGGARFRSTIADSDADVAAAAAVTFDSEGRSIMHEMSRMDQQPQPQPQSSPRQRTSKTAAGGGGAGSFSDMSSWRSLQQRRPSTAGGSSTTSSLPRIRSGSMSSRAAAPAETTTLASPRRNRLPLEAWHCESPFGTANGLRSPTLSPQSDAGGAPLAGVESSPRAHTQSQPLPPPAARSPSQREDLVRRAVRTRLWKDSSEHWRAVQRRPSSADSVNASPFAYHHASDPDGAMMDGGAGSGSSSKGKHRSLVESSANGGRHLPHRSSRRSFIASPPLEMNSSTEWDLSTTLDVDALRAAAEFSLARPSSSGGGSKTVETSPMTPSAPPLPIVTIDAAPLRASCPPPSASTGASRETAAVTSAAASTATLSPVVARPRSAPQRTLAHAAGPTMRSAMEDEGEEDDDGATVRRPSTATGRLKPFGADASGDALKHLLPREGERPSLRHAGRRFTLDDSDAEERRRPTTAGGAPPSTTTTLRRPRSMGPQQRGAAAAAAAVGGSSSSSPLRRPATSSGSGGAGHGTWTPGSKNYVHADEAAMGPHSALGLSAIEFQYLLLEAQARGDREEVRRLLGRG